MHPAELAILLHRALEVRLARLQELLEAPRWSEDVEQLHQARVAARRLGAVLDLVDPEVYPGHRGQRRALKRLVAVLGQTRESDVQAEHLKAHLLRAPGPLQAAVLEYLLEGVDRRRAKARRTLGKGLKRLRLPDLDRLLRVPALQDPFQSTSLQTAAWACLEPRAAAALGGLDRLADQEDPSAMHKARIRIKKLRYAVEALEGAFAEVPEAALEALQALQTVLGEHHDLAALEALLQEVGTHLRLRQRTVLGEGVLTLLGQVAQDRRGAFGRFVTLARGQDPAAFARSIRPALGLPPAGDRP